MNCKNIEESIFLYKELSLKERALVDKHITGCSSCKELLIQVNHQYQLTSKAAEIPVPTGNSERIKFRIMKGLEPNQKINLLDRIFLLFEYRWLQSAMGIVSITLIGFFVSEITSASNLAFNKSYKTDVAILNTQRFLQTYIKRRESPKTISLYDQIKNSDFKNSKD